MPTLSPAVAATGTLVPRGDFPVTPVLDSFDRPGTTSPPSASWTAMTSEFNAELALNGDGDTVVGGPQPDYSGDAWATAFDADQEAYFTKAALDTLSWGAGMNFRVDNLIGSGASNWNGYQLWITPTDIQVFKNRGGGANYVMLQQWAYAEAVGDSFGMRVTTRPDNSVDLAVWAKRSGALWTLIAILNDSAANSILHSGYISLSAPPPTSCKLDDFGGGNVHHTTVSAATAATGTLSPA